MRTRLRPLPLAVLALLAPLVAGAQVRTDGTLGAPARTLAGPTYAITENLGRRAGNNLFHSFQTFSVGSGETALFSTTTPTIANVIGRVTGGAVSAIDGTIRLQAAAGTPALFLINPAGVVFGGGAAIDVPGAFHVSTADSVRFPDGAFHADPARASTFSSAPPEAFGFLGEQRAAVVVQGAQLSSWDSPLSIVAGDVTLRDGATLQNHGGELRVVAVGQQTMQVPLDREPGPLRGTVTIEGKSSLQMEALSDAAAGRIRVGGGRIELTGSSDPDDFTSHILTSAEAGGAGGAVLVRADEALVLTGGARILSTASGDGTGGEVQVTAGALRIDAAGEFVTGIRSVSAGRGPAGDVAIRVTGDAQVTGRYASIASTAYEGPVGTVEVSAMHLRLENGARIESTASGSQGAAITIASENLSVLGGRIDSKGTAPGRIDIAVKDTLSVADDGRISNRSTGLLQLRARQVLLDSGTIESVNLSAKDDSAGLTITAAERVELRNGSRIGMSTVSAGSSGSLVLRAGSLVLDDSSIGAEVSGPGDVLGSSGDILISVVGEAELRNQSLLSTRIEAGKDNDNTAGDIVVHAKELSVRNSVIESTSGADENVGRRLGAGNVTLEVEGQLLLTNDGKADFSGIRTWQKQTTFEPTPGGGIAIRAGRLSIQGHEADVQKTGIVTTTDFGMGRNVDIEVREDASLRFASLKSEGSNAGDGGSVRLKAGTTIRLDDSSIDATTSSPGGVQYGWGRSGSIHLEASAVQLAGKEDIGTSITSDGSIFSGTGGAGTVRLNASGPLTLRGRVNVSTYSYAFEGDNPGILVPPENRRIVAGNIDVQAGSLLMEGITSISTNTASDARRPPTGHAGRIAVRVGGAVELRQGASILAETFGTEEGGAVSIQAASLLIDRDGSPASTGVSTTAFRTLATGNAGSIDILLAGDLQVRGGATITSSAGLGAAGKIQVQASNVLLTGVYTGPPFKCDICWADGVFRSGIEAFTWPTSAGPTGDVSVSASDRIAVTQGAQIVTLNQNKAAGGNRGAAPSLVRLSAPHIELRDFRNAVNAASTGNVAASDVQVDASRLLVIENSRIVTSALGSAGDGGNIRITAPVVALETGFVQANAIAAGATGGDIVMNIGALLPSHESVRVAGSTPAVFQARLAGGNVIQAVAPTGVNGNIQISSPQLDLASTLTLVSAGTLPNEPLGKSPCQRTGGSSLGLAGHGGLPPSAAEPVGAHLADAASGPAVVASVVRLAGPAGCVGS